MGDDDIPIQRIFDGIHQCAKGGCSGDNEIINAVNQNVHAVEVVFRIDVALLRPFVSQRATRKTCNANLANGRHVGIRRFNVDRDEFHL